MAATNPIPSDPNDKTSTGRAAKKLLKLDQPRGDAPKSRASNGSTTVGGRAVSGGAKVRGGRA